MTTASSPSRWAPLAIFAAPGGMLLLPLVAKLLPFSVLPSAWEKTGASKRKRAAT